MSAKIWIGVGIVGFCLLCKYTPPGCTELVSFILTYALLVGFAIYSKYDRDTSQLKQQVRELEFEVDWHKRSKQLCKC